MLKDIKVPEGFQRKIISPGEDPSAEAMKLGPGWVTVSPEGDVFAVSLPLAAPLSEAKCFPHLTALCAAEVMGPETKIHWPCDVMLTNERVCTVRCRAGEGVIAPMLTISPMEGVDMAALIGDIAARLAELAAGFPGNLEERLQDYCNRSILLKKGVDVLYRGMPLNGYAFAVDRTGGLMVMTESRTVITLHSGPVKLAGPKDDPMPDLPNPGRV